MARMLGLDFRHHGGVYYCCSAHTSSRRLKQKSHGAARAHQKREVRRALVDL